MQRATGFCNAIGRVFRRIGTPKFGFSAANDQLAGLAEAVFEVDLDAAAANSGGVSGKRDRGVFKIPYGDYPVTIFPASGRPFRGVQRLDKASAQAMAAAFNSAGRLFTNPRGLPVYEGHPDLPAWKAANGGTEAAVGRIKGVEAGEDALLLTEAFNARGVDLLSGEGAPYSAQSPHWGMEKTGETAANGLPVFRPAMLYSSGLTNTPNIPGALAALNQKTEEPTEPTEMKLLASTLALLGIEASAAEDPAAVNSAVEAIHSRAQSAEARATGAETAKADAVNQKVAAINARDAAIAERDAALDARADTLADAAVNTGRIAGSDRDKWRGKFRDAGADAEKLAAVNADLPAAGTVKPGASGAGAGAGASAANGGSAADAAAARKGGNTTPGELSPKQRVTAINAAINAKLAACGNDRAAAYKAAEAENPDLFKAGNAAASQG